MGSPVADSFPWENYSACLEEILGDKWDILGKEGFWTDAAASAPVFKTSSGKFEFAGGFIDLARRLCPVNAEGDPKAYPLLLIPYDSMRIASGYIGDPPFAVKTVEDTVLEREGCPCRGKSCDSQGRRIFGGELCNS